VRVDFAPGAAFPRHSHPGEEIVYAIGGAMEYQLDGKPSVTLRTGEVLFIPAGAIHAATNVGGGPAAGSSPPKSSKKASPSSYWPGEPRPATVRARMVLADGRSPHRDGRGAAPAISKEPGLSAGLPRFRRPSLIEIRS
jgi:hypothetical protein